MNKLFLLSFLIVTISFTSCKKCDPSNSIDGSIIEDAIVRVYGGNSGNNFITDVNGYDKLIEVSFDGGKNYGSIDFSKYSVFSLTTTAYCSSGYNRNVTVNKKDSTVNYTVSITECNTCQNIKTINNWVLTTVVPSHYDESFNIKKN